jgi:hypothetical protein
MKTLLALLFSLVLMVGLASPAQAVDIKQPRRTVYINDSTSWKWPVGRAAKVWNNGGSVRLIWGTSCRAGYPCVYVKPSKWISPAVGLTNITYSNGYILSARIRMNWNYRNYPYTLKRAWVAHELAHALGIMHSSRTSSIMYYRVGYYNSYPTWYDYYRLRTKYYGVRW